MNKTETYGLTHIAVVVKDINKTLLFYTSVFGMEVMYHGRDFVQLTTPGCNDILVFETAPEDQIGIIGGITHFGFRLRNKGDIEIMADKINAAGGKITDKGEFVPGSPYIFFRDPDGYEVEVWYEESK
jgi:catechol 2,3-dioxygenase-like lactoylglutathione lyase family enzyme